MSMPEYKVYIVDIFEKYEELVLEPSYLHGKCEPPIQPSVIDVPDCRITMQTLCPVTLFG